MPKIFSAHRMRKVESARLQFMTVGKEILSAADPKRKDTLVLAVNILSDVGRFKIEEIAEICNVHKLTIFRWRAGTHLPESGEKRSIYVAALKKHLYQRITDKTLTLSL